MSSSSNADQQASGRAGPSTAPNNYGPVIVDSATYTLTPIPESPSEDPISSAVEALEHLTLREVGNSYIIDTPRAIGHLTDTLLDLPTSPPSLYLSISGTSIARNGSISLIQLLVLPTNRTYLIDIHTLRSSAFTTAGPRGRTFQSILEDAAIPKHPRPPAHGARHTPTPTEQEIPPRHRAVHHLRLVLGSIRAAALERSEGEGGEIVFAGVWGGKGGAGAEAGGGGCGGVCYAGFGVFAGVVGVL
ncbi:hypothetical protein V499_02262 [Pseudogymnoascus sp. VKM F-103]|nr:hypothetical protein V499_02262 [Pseudogymnoascus sp. VKM F-103]